MHEQQAQLSRDTRPGSRTGHHCTLFPRTHPHVHRSHLQQVDPLRLAVVVVHDAVEAGRKGRGGRGGGVRAACEREWRIDEHSSRAKRRSRACWPGRQTLQRREQLRRSAPTAWAFNDQRAHPGPLIQSSFHAPWSSDPASLPRTLVLLSSLASTQSTKRQAHPPSFLEICSLLKIR